MKNLDYNHRQAQLHYNRWAISQKEVDSAVALYKGGKTTLDQVLQAQRRHAQAQTDYYRVLGAYTKAIADVHFRKGTLLEYNDIHLSEGAWPGKAYADAMDRARQRDASRYLDYGFTRPGVISRGTLETLATQDLADAVEPEADDGGSEDEAKSDKPTLPATPPMLDFSPAVPTPAKPTSDSDI
jgi:hypothetical protein